MKHSPSSASSLPRAVHEAPSALAASSAGFIEPESGARAEVRRLMAGEHYFGVEALAFHQGAQRMLARIAKMPSHHDRVDLRSLSEDFCVAGTATPALLSALLGGGLLHPDGSGGYRPTALFKEYATACVVTPLTRERARALLENVAALAARINSRWTRNRYAIEAIAVSGSYMSRRDPVSDLSLWLIVRPRGDRRPRGNTAPLRNDHAVRQMGRAIKAISSFISVQVETDRQSVSRPFAIVFQASEDAMEESARARQPWTRTLASLMLMEISIPLPLRAKRNAHSRH